MARATSIGRLLAVVGAVAALSALSLGCGSSSNETKASAGDVTVADFSFSPKIATIKPGETVTWTNRGQTDHTVKGRGFFSSKAFGNGQAFRHRFTRAGRFAYICTLHPTLMRGTVLVRG